jgi:hypothetical protein
MSGLALGIPVGLAMGMGSGVAIGMASGMQAGRRQASKDVAAWLQQHGVVLTTPDRDSMDAQALLAVIAGKPGNRG